MSRRLAVLAIALALAVAATPAALACSSSKGSSSTATTEKGSDYEIVSDAEVAAGLATVESYNAQVVQTLPTDQAAAKALVDQLYDQWYVFEGTVKQNSVDLYLDLEDGLGSVKNGADDGDVAKAQKGATAFSTAAASYLAQWPGTGTPSSPPSSANP